MLILVPRQQWLWRARFDMRSAPSSVQPRTRFNFVQPCLGILGGPNRAGGPRPTAAVAGRKAQSLGTGLKKQAALPAAGAMNVT